MFGKRIVELRKKQGLTQAALARSIGISRSALSLYEIEKREPDIETLNKLASLFKVPVGYILGNEQEINDYANYTMDTPKFALEFKMRIRDLMTEQKISEDEFIKKTGFPSPKKNSYLCNKKIPSIEDLIKIAKTLSVSADYLLNLSNSKIHINVSEKNNNEEKLINTCRQLNNDNQDIIIGEMKKLLKEQYYEESVAAEESLKRTGTDNLGK